jgi:hypothetical protein
MHLHTPLHAPEMKICIFLFMQNHVVISSSCVCVYTAVYVRTKQTHINMYTFTKYVHFVSAQSCVRVFVLLYL